MVTTCSLLGSVAMFVGPIAEHTPRGRDLGRLSETLDADSPTVRLDDRRHNGADQPRC